MKLYGSQTSPFVRRIRLLLAQKPFDFINVNIFEPAGRAQLASLSPVMKLPVFEDDGLTIYDSRQIFYYLTKKGIGEDLTWEQENILTIISDLNDSFVNMLLLKRSEMELKKTSVLGRGHHERIELSLAYLEKQAKAETFSKWNFISISLYSLLDWVNFRELYDLSRYSELKKFVLSSAQQPMVAETDPRRS